MALIAHADETARSLFGGGQPTPLPCAVSERRQFDFWLGRWHVTQRDGSAGGHNRISQIVDGCALLEDYEGGRQRGRSVSAFRLGDRRWLQTYVDSTGLTLRLAGTFGDGRVALADAPRELPAAGLTLLSQLTWTPRADGSVDQLWRLSRDGGGSWATSFEGRYEAAASLPDPDPRPRAGDACGAARPAYRALDDLIGAWRVEDASGERLGHSIVEAGVGACLLEERFEGREGYRAHRLIAFDRYVREWIWFHVDNRGHVERLVSRSGGIPMSFGDELPGGPGLCLGATDAGPTFRRGVCDGASASAHEIHYRRAADASP